MTPPKKRAKPKSKPKPLPPAHPQKRPPKRPTVTAPNDDYSKLVAFPGTLRVTATPCADYTPLTFTSGTVTIGTRRGPVTVPTQHLPWWRRLWAYVRRVWA